MVKKNDSQNYHTRKENNSRRRQYIQGNPKKHNKRERSCSSTEERGRSNLERRWSGVYGRKDLCTE